jgi:hypothetical protein
MDEDADTAGAERAFDALRAEVASLRQAIDGQTVPDYALTLGAIVKELQAVVARLAAIESHPALTMTPQRYAERVADATEHGRQAREREVRDAKVQLGEAVRRVEQLAGHLHTRLEQRQWVGAAVACGVVLGIALWYVLPSLLPWGAGDWLAASLIGGGRWRAGEMLMQRASPQSYDRMVRLYTACGERPIEQCEADLATPATTPEPGNASKKPNASLRPRSGQ